MREAIINEAASKRIRPVIAPLEGPGAMVKIVMGQDLSITGRLCKAPEGWISVEDEQGNIYDCNRDKVIYIKRYKNWKMFAPIVLTNG